MIIISAFVIVIWLDGQEMAVQLRQEFINPRNGSWDLTGGNNIVQKFTDTFFFLIKIEAR